MKSFEPIYYELDNLFIHTLPVYIEKLNEQYNDGIILKPFANKSLQENCVQHPCFKFSVETGEYSEKDRIIENTIFQCSFDIKIKSMENETSILWRYIEAINKMFIEEGTNIIILSIKASKIILRITIS